MNARGESGLLLRPREASALLKMLMGMLPTTIRCGVAVPQYSSQESRLLPLGMKDRVIPEMGIYLVVYADDFAIVEICRKFAEWERC